MCINVAGSCDVIRLQAQLHQRLLERGLYTVRDHEARPLTALFGPKFQTSSGRFRAYLTGKVGFVNFSVSDQNASSGFVGALGGVETGERDSGGRIGLRLE